MADYNSINDAISAGTSNMTVLRDNTRSASGLRTLDLGEIDWFIFNNQTITTIYISADSFIGFLDSSTHNLDINYQSSCEVWSEYVETGVIRGHEYVRYFFDGASNSSKNSGQYYQNPDYLLQWTMFLFDTGQIYVHINNKPSSYYSGRWRLTCGSQYIDFSGLDIYFTPKDPDAGTSWVSNSGQPHLPYYYEHAYYTIDIPGANILTNIVDSRIEWIERSPRGSSVNVQMKVNSSEFYDLTNGESLPNDITEISSINSLTLKVVLNSNENRGFSPTLFNLYLVIYDENSSNNIVLIFQKGNQTNFANAPSGIIVNYDGTGRIMGYGGPVAAFSEMFYPTDLIPKPNVADIERILTSVSEQDNLMKIDYLEGTGSEHIEMFLYATGTLIHVDDL